MLRACALPVGKNGGWTDARAAPASMPSRSPERRRLTGAAHHRRLSQSKAIEEGKGSHVHPSCALPHPSPFCLFCPLTTEKESAASAATVQEWGSKEAARCDDGDPDLELCELPEVLDSAAPAPRTTIDEALSRGRWLVGLLVLQSSSSFILDSYQDLIRQHLVVTLFLTMLVGAGGNAGNQSAIKVIRGLATGTIKPTGASMRRVLRQQAIVALLLGAGLSAAGWVRVYLTHGDAVNSTAIAISLYLIVVTSVMLGAALPFGLARLGVDPANAGTSIQVLMDCFGVLITCVCCHYVLDVLAQGVAVVS